MKKLSADWFIEGTLDFEYKKYILLAYLQQVSQEFAHVRLYPSFSELIHHYKNLAAFKESKQKLMDRFPVELSQEDFKKLKLAFHSAFEDTTDLAEIESIIEYSIPVIKEHLKEGKDIYEFLNQLISIEPIGITPLYNQEGYVLLRVNTQKEVKVYEYRIIFMENTDANYYGISMEHVDSFTYGISNTYESIKLSMIRNHKKFPNPATFLVYADQPIPEESSLLPVTKRKMLAYLK